MLFAHYYGSKAKGFTVRITTNVRPIDGVVIPVSGKVEAKKIAAQHSAKPYNF